ncbi:probable ATP-dependent DNA helicase HFM1 [Varroa destructor]|uniref:P-loop containing nucleoside triphosphate hydrolase protein n=1 Tax=Varroa destructor TaxID=109461 RepID=A0A7M7M8N8_VARDE|nr:probable ATP-dependent DNA helicase HFM1 [Varroa destructor]
MQSKCLPILWHSSDSLVVAAPTGSGKTVLLELAICRAVEDYGSEALAVYIAPTRCLVQQKVSEWRERFAALRLKVTEVTGDLNEVCDAGNGDMSTNLICTTPEKWDTELRLGAGYTWLSSRKVSVYLIDEVHMVGEPDRGPILEAVLTRTIVRCMPQSLLPRFVAISATIANPNDIGQWLGRNTPWHGYSFGERARTIPIEASVKGVYCPPDRSPFHFDANLNYKLPSLLREVLPANKSAIIFVSSRAATVICARCLVNKQSWARSSSREELRRVARFCKDKKLSDYLEHGVGFHNAGLSSEDRSLVEKTFNQGDLRVLVCTSTLAMGVNLPAYLVVVRGTTMITGGICGQYSAARIHQMIGRAGRPGLEGSGKAIIMTTSNHVALSPELL